MSVTELGSDETVLHRSRILVLATGIAACFWQPAFYFFVGTYALGVLAFLFQRRFIYRPATRRYRTPAQSRLADVSEVWLNSTDGEQILSWQAAPDEGKPTILYLHGNNCNLSNRLERISRFRHDGYGLLMPSFRGYGLSTGRPSETNNVNDALLAYDSLRRRGVRAQDIVVYGESLGTGVAVQVAAKRPVGALVLEAPYTSLRDLVRYRWPQVPVYKFVRDRFNSIEHIKKVKAPLLIVHSLGDSVIPIAFGRWLFEAANAPKEFLRIRGAGHYGVFRSGAWPKIRGFIERHVERADEKVLPVREASGQRPGPEQRQAAG